jgi:single-stranded-DNA-specific exonuclease
MEKRWTLLPQAGQEEVKQLSQELNKLEPVLANLLIQRGVDSFEKAKDFFRPSLDKLHDPFLMKDMDKAVERIQRAFQEEENILIYGDYDVDGTTSVALVYSFLQHFYPHLSYYIPDRYKEGYGISYQGIDFAEANDISLIIALDCGIKANEKIEYAQQKGIDFIICDHHLPGDSIPKAYAVLDPKRNDCAYPFKELSGCGVGFKFMQALCARAEFPEELLIEKLDFLAVSICADIVPIVGENRIFTFFGLQKLNSSPQPGFKAMLDIANVRKKALSVTDVVFTLAPRINAAGRIESGNKAVELMLSESTQAAWEGGNNIDNFNSDRKELDKAITEEALQMIADDKVLQSKKTTVLYKSTWHKGVIGIVASRCIEQYYRPTIILTESNGKLAGSARSVKGFNVYNALEQCADILEQFGGHKYAAGLSLTIENLSSFQERFEEVVSSNISEELLTPEIEIDAPLSLSAINHRMYKVLKQFAPFGPSNMKPVFLSKGLLAEGRIVGNDHLKLDLIDEKTGARCPGIAFGLGHKLHLLESNQGIDVVYTIEENEWNGNVSLQLNVKDLKATS